MRFWIGVSAAFGAGALIGAGVTRLILEDKMKKDYEQSVASMRRVLLAQKIDSETPALTEEELQSDLPVVIQPRGEGVRLMGEGGLLTVKEDPKTGLAHAAEVVSFDAKVTERAHQIIDHTNKGRNPYHTPVQQTVLVTWAELEEEEYYEEDGRVKSQITMVYSDDKPHFFEGNEEIEDWMDRLGGTIVDDMRKTVGEGRPVLWIRNNQTEVDYEVIFEQA